jgi:hypothetical protein
MRQKENPRKSPPYRSSGPKVPSRFLSIFTITLVLFYIQYPEFLAIFSRKYREKYLCYTFPGEAWKTYVFNIHI